MAERASPLTRRLISDGLRQPDPHVAPGLQERFFDAALLVLESAKAVPISQRRTLAASIAWKCVHIAEQERAA